MRRRVWLLFDDDSTGERHPHHECHVSMLGNVRTLSLGVDARRNSNDPAAIGFKAWDGTNYSAEATIEVTIIPVDGLPTAGSASYAIDEDVEQSIITLYAADADSDFVSIFITKLPEHGTLYEVVTREGGLVRGKAIAEVYSPWEVFQPIEQYASNVRAVSTFFWTIETSQSDAGNGYPGYHAFQILGPQDAPNSYGDSAFAYCPESRNGDDKLYSFGDEWISFSHNAWASYLSDGYTEYIEVRLICHV